MADMLRDGHADGEPQTPDETAVECSPAVMQQVHSEVAEAFYSTPRGGVETGGVLYGVHENSRVTIQAARSLRCEHASGPSFTLSASDLVRFAELLRAPAQDRSLAGMVPVGWYHSHTRSEIALTDSDLEFHRRYFPEPWQFAMVLRPAPMRPTRVCFYFQEPGKGLRSSELYRELTPRAPRPVLAAPRPRTPEPAPLRTPAPMPPPPPRGSHLLWPVSAILAVLLALAGAAYVTRDYWSPRVPGTSEANLRLEVTDRAGQLEVRWDRNLPFVRQAIKGTLEFQDGGMRRFTALDPQFLRVGSVTYARQSDTVTIHMVLEKPDGSQLEGMASYLGQAPQPAAVAPPAPAPSPPEDLEALAERKRQRELDAAREREKKRLTAQQSKARPAPVQTPPAQTAAAPAPAPPPQPQAQPQTVALAESRPAAQPPPQAAPAPAASTPVSQPKPEAAASKPAALPPAPLTGRWSVSRSQPSGSPFPPESVTLSLSENGNWLQGTLTGRYRAPRNSGFRSDVSFSFGGPVRPGSMKFPWTAGDGSKGEIELIRLPNSSDSIEVVWYPANRKYVFNDILARPGR